jgi:hypothetical protein
VYSPIASFVVLTVTRWQEMKQIKNPNKSTPKTKVYYTSLRSSNTLCQIPRTVRIIPLTNTQMITQYLKRDNIDQALQTIHRLGYSDTIIALEDRGLVTLINHADWSTATSRHLHERAFDFLRLLESGG